MSCCKVRGGLKSSDRAGASGASSKKRVHFIDETNVTNDELKHDGAQAEAQVCQFANETPKSLDEVFEKVLITCGAYAQAAAANSTQNGGILQEELPQATKEKPSSANSFSKATGLCEVGEICSIENESPSTPPPCVASYDRAVSNGVPHLPLRVNGVQRKLTFVIRPSEQCHRKFGISKKKNLSRSQNYKVVPEAEDGSALLTDILTSQDVINLQMQSSGLLSQEHACKKRCAWITPQSDPVYVAYHDEEWGVPVHEDRRLFELLVFAGAQAEIAWSSILAKREAYRDIFAQFDPTILATYDTKKVASLISHNDIMRSETRVQSITSNAKLVMKIVEEYGSFDAYLWGFVSNRAIVNKYRQAKVMPVRTGKSEAISKDLQRRGFRHAGSIVVYSLMQAAGLANDHLLSCFRHHALLLPPSPPPPPSLRIKPALARKPLVSPLCCTLTT